MVVSRHPYGVPRRVLRHVAKHFQVVLATDGAEPRDPATIANEYEEDSDLDEFSPKVPSILPAQEDGEDEGEKPVR